MQRESVMGQSEAFPRSLHSYWIKWVKTNLIFCKSETQLLNALLILLRWCGSICWSSLTVLLDLLVHFRLLCALPGFIRNHVRTITFGLTANKSAKTLTGRWHTRQRSFETSAFWPRPIQSNTIIPPVFLHVSLVLGEGPLFTGTNPTREFDDSWTVRILNRGDFRRVSDSAEVSVAYIFL